MKSYKRLLLSNQAWVNEKLRLSPDYFQQLAVDQKPEFLWIGCSDSRVPAEEVTGTHPGELFVHRNIANLVVHTDLNLQSVLQYATENLCVSHIIVCGHYGCGGVRASMGHQNLGMLNKWLRNIKDIYRLHHFELDAEPDEKKRTNRLVELNVMEQVQNLMKSSVVQHSWKRFRRPDIHGWVYDLETGLLKELVHVGPDTPIDLIYQFDFSADDK